MRRSVRIGAAAAGVALGSLLFSPTAHAAPAPNTEKWALLIGVSDYEEPTVDTPGSANDARDMREVLVRSGWPEDHIRVLIDGDATGEAMRAGMDWLVENSGPDAFVLFHYSGHTKQLQSGWEDGDAEEWDEYLWSAWNEWISDGEFAQRMTALRGPAWINISNCEAAGFDDGISSPTRLVTTSSQEDEKGYERADIKRSIFTGLMTQAFLTGQPDPDKNGAVSIQEAFDYAAANAPTLSAEGSHGPQHPYIAGGDNSPWYLKPPTPAQQKSESLIPPGIIPPGLLPPGLLPGILPAVTPQTP